MAGFVYARICKTNKLHNNMTRTECRQGCDRMTADVAKRTGLTIVKTGVENGVWMVLYITTEGKPMIRQLRDLLKRQHEWK